MRTTLAIDDDVLTEAKEIAAAEGRSVGAVISALARRALEPVGIREDDDGFPLFEVTSGARSFGSAEVERALDDA